jgi:hypothetical protein
MQCYTYLPIKQNNHAAAESGQKLIPTIYFLRKDAKLIWIRPNFSNFPRIAHAYLSGMGFNDNQYLIFDMRCAEWVEKDTYRQQPDAKRFEDWEFAYSTVLGTGAAISYCREIGEDRIWKQVKFLSGLLRKDLNANGKIRVLDKGPELAGLVTFTAEHSDPLLLIRELSKRKINVVPSYRTFGVIDFDEKGARWAIGVPALLQYR